MSVASECSSSSSSSLVQGRVVGVNVHSVVFVLTLVLDDICRITHFTMTRLTRPPDSTPPLHLSFAALGQSL